MLPEKLGKRPVLLILVGAACDRGLGAGTKQGGQPNDWCTKIAILTNYCYHFGLRYVVGMAGRKDFYALGPQDVGYMPMSFAPQRGAPTE